MDPAREPAPDAAERSAVSGAISCATALALVRRFVAGDEDVEARPRMRAHLAACPACRDQYRGEVVLVARLARGGARSLESVRRMESRAGRSLDRERRGGRRVTLARLVLPAIGLYALYAIAGPGEGGPARYACLAGTAHHAGAPIARTDAPVELQRGGLCATEAGRARLEWAGNALVLEPETALRFERQDPLRARLFYGRVLVEGGAVLSTVAGVVEIESGSAVVELSEGGLSVACSRGAARIVDVAGTQTIEPGESAARAALRTAQR
ncbi:MAG: hypothetical protein HZA53_16605 [Planctomycetes bacterium]|nr:hypothetical protein [Planctomycetota bacterium]